MSWVLGAILMTCSLQWDESGGGGVAAATAAAAANMWLLLCSFLLCLTQMKSPSTFRGSLKSLDTQGAYLQMP